MSFHCGCNVFITIFCLATGTGRARKDREVHHAGLDAVEELAQGELADIVRQLCLALGTTDAAALPAVAAGLQRAVAALPRLERFVTDVCEVLPTHTALQPREL